jgi:hypothetical protein
MPIPPTVPSVDEAAGIIDELQSWFLARADAEGYVYTGVLRQLMNRMCRDRDYLEKLKRQGQRTAFDYAIARDQKALAWAVRALVRQTSPEEKVRPEPPKPPRKPSRRLTSAQKARLTGPSWNGQPKQDLDGLDLPPRRPSS